MGLCFSRAMVALNLCASARSKELHYLSGMNRLTTVLALVAACIGPLCSAQNSNISSGFVFEGEPYIAQNPVNPQHLVVAWMGFVFNSGSGLTIKTKTSFDGGLSWSSAVAIPHENEAYASADPSLSIATNGDVLLCYIDHSQDPYGGGVYFRKSTDGGLSWGNAVLAVDIFADGEEFPIDRPWFSMSADGQWVYLTTMPPSFAAMPNRPYLWQSNDGGATWSDFEFVDGVGGLVGNLVARPMAPPAMGTSYAYTIYPSYVFGQNPLPTIILSRQALGSSTREYFTALAASSESEPGSAKMGYKLLVDPSNEEHLSAVFVVGEGSDLDIQMIDSYDGGASWSDLQRVNDDAIGNNRMQDLVWADYDEDGDLVVSWRDRRNADAAGYEQPTQIYCAYRASGESSFSPNFALTDQATPHNAILNENGNDFMCIAFHQDTLHAVWGSTTDGSLDIWYTRRAIADEVSEVPVLLTSESAGFFVVRQNNALKVSLYEPGIIQRVQVKTMSGGLVVDQSVQADQTSIGIDRWPPGCYIVSVEFQGKTLSQKFMIW
jgi:hypothetical protein